MEKQPFKCQLTHPQGDEWNYFHARPGARGPIAGAKMALAASRKTASGSARLLARLAYRSSACRLSSYHAVWEECIGRRLGRRYALLPFLSFGPSGETRKRRMRQRFDSHQL